MSKRTKIKLTKAFSLDIRHALYKYDGEPKDTYGPSVQLQITVSGYPLVEPNHPKDGMVVDFIDLKNTIKEIIITPFNHAVILNEKSHSGLKAHLKGIHEKIIEVPFQPTCENILLYFVELLQDTFKEMPNVELARLRLYETVSSYVEWNYETEK